MKDFDDPIRIGNKEVGSNCPAFVIAEAGVNHFGNVEIARHLIDMAVIARADAVKFQIYKTRNLISGVAPDWIERMQAKELPYAAFNELSQYCKQKGIIFLATAHDEESLEFLRTLDPPAYKIGSGELSNLEFLSKVAECGKPVLLSTGMYDMEDVREAVEFFAKTENRQLILLHCTTRYPPSPEEIDLRAIQAMQREFGLAVGYSDHSIGIEIVLAAAALGAAVIEKHIAVSKHAPNSQDCPVSCDAKDLIEMINGIRKIERAMGCGKKKPSESEMQSRAWARKSIVARKDIQKGEKITEQMLAMKRPGTGLSPKQLSLVVGSIAKRDIKTDALLSTADFERD